jgi:hypothetical protein
VAAITATSSLNTGTRHGLFTVSASGRFDDFLATA